MAGRKREALGSCSSAFPPRPDAHHGQGRVGKAARIGVEAATLAATLRVLRELFAE